MTGWSWPGTAGRDVRRKQPLGNRESAKVRFPKPTRTGRPRPAAGASDRPLWVRLSPHRWVCQESGCLVANIGIRRLPSKPLPPALGRDILVSMTRKAPTLAVPTAQPPRSRWRLQDAKARFSELVRMAHSDGPQHVTLHGRDAVVVVDADEFNRLKGARTGELLIEALQASPHRQIEIEPRRSAMPVRAVKL